MFANQPKRTKLVNFLITERDYARLVELATERDLTLSQVLRSGLRREFAANGQPAQVQTGG